MLPALRADLYNGLEEQLFNAHFPFSFLLSTISFMHVWAIRRRIPFLSALFEKNMKREQKRKWFFQVAAKGLDFLNFICYIRTVLPMQKHVADQKIIKAAEEQKEMEEDDRIRAHFKAKQRVATMMKEKEAEMRR